MDLAGIVIDSEVKSLAVVGTAKNVGKTVTMNYLASRLSERGKTIGLISSGRDGETIDSFTGEPKPSVIPPQGSWVATAEGVLGDSGTSLEIVDVSERPGLLGRLVVGRAIEPFPLELVGPQSAQELAVIVRRLLSLGADIVLVDGALDRLSAASPRVTEGAILVTGASSQDNLKSIGQDMGRLTWLWSRPVPRCWDVRDLAQKAVSSGLVSFLDPAPRSAREPRLKIRQTPYETCLGREEDIFSQVKDAAYVVVPGAVTATFLNGAASWVEREDFAVIAKDPISVFSWDDPGVGLLVLDQINLLAVTVNPMSYRGISYDPARMVSVVSRETRRGYGKWVPVFDVVTGESNQKEVAGVALG